MACGAHSASSNSRRSRWSRSSSRRLVSSWPSRVPSQAVAIGSLFTPWLGPLMLTEPCLQHHVNVVEALDWRGQHVLWEAAGWGQVAPLTGSGGQCTYFIGTDPALPARHVGTWSGGARMQKGGFRRTCRLFDSTDAYRGVFNLTCWSLRIT